MGKLHLVPGYSAAGSLRQAFRLAGFQDEAAAWQPDGSVRQGFATPLGREEMVIFPDDLSCGPIDRIDATSRITWWNRIWDFDDQGPRIAAFWQRLANPDETVVVWTGRGSASEHCFLLAVAHALRGQAFSLIDVTGMGMGADEPSWRGRLGTQVPNVLRGLIGTERGVGEAEQAALAARWEGLQRENAPFRVATEQGVVSVPDDYFDDDLLAEASEQPTRAARVIGGAMGRGRAYMQVDDVMLLVRLVALVEAGRLVADGDPWNMRECFVRLPGSGER